MCVHHQIIAELVRQDDIVTVSSAKTIADPYMTMVKGLLSVTKIPVVSLGNLVVAKIHRCLPSRVQFVTYQVPAAHVRWVGCRSTQVKLILSLS